MTWRHIGALAVFAIGCTPVPGATQVRVRLSDGRAGLMRAGTPFVIRGAGGDGSSALLARCGANAIRTWGADRLGATLDEAQKHGLMVAAGIWLGHERHGFKYGDAEQVAKQQDMVREVVEKYKDHPALLLWSLGNEMEGDGSNAAVWLAVNSAAAIVKRLDPNHPTMTVIAEVGGQKVRNLHRLCPDVDIVGINSYGGAASVAERYTKAGGIKPFVLTEFGPPGTWEVEKTPWGAPVEMTSTAKADWYRRAWQSSTASPICLGGFAFAWGHKQEATATWFGMLLPDGARLGAVDAMTEMWTGKPPANRCPAIRTLALSGSGDVEPKATITAKLDAADPDGDAVSVRWVLQHETARYGSGGDAEAAPPIVDGAIRRGSTKDADILMPAEPGPYRLYAYVSDGKGGAATANIPLRVKGEVKPVAAQVAKLPLVIYAEQGIRGPYIPSGWMGLASAVKVDEACRDRPRSGATCMRFDYAASGDWAGVVWQDPEGDWGDRPGGWNLSGARKLTFWARGARGGEVVGFLLGTIGRDKPYFDTAQVKLDSVRLTAEWALYTLDLAGKDLARIKTGFGWVAAGQGSPIAFYLDDIRIE